jgi:hypothetical protein
MLVLVGFGRSWQHMETSLVVGTCASSRTRSGINYGESRQCLVGQVAFRCGWVCSVKETTYTVGVVAASMLQGGMDCGRARYVRACRGSVG